jgi:putative transcriptional regulator
MSDHAKDISQDYLEHLMVDYASGALDEALSLVMASYISLSPYAQEQLRHLENIGGALLCQDCPPQEMNKDSLANVLDKLDECLTEAIAELEEIELALHCDIPTPITQHISAHSPSAKAPQWERKLNGIEAMVIPLSAECENNVSLMKIAPGIPTPEHTHRGLELTLVLDGAFTDETGSYETGAILIHDERIKHQPVSCPQQGCVCLVATDAPLRFTRGWMRLLNPFLK